MKRLITLAFSFLASLGLMGQTLDWTVVGANSLSPTSVEICFGAVPTGGVATGCFGGGNLVILFPDGGTTGAITSITSTWSVAPGSPFVNAGGTGLTLVQFNSIAAVNTDLTMPFDLFCVVIDGIDCSNSDVIRLMVNDFVGPSDDFDAFSATFAFNTATTANNDCSMSVGTGAEYNANTPCTSIDPICPHTAATVNCGGSNTEATVEFTIGGGASNYMIDFGSGSGSVGEGVAGNVSTGINTPGTHSYTITDANGCVVDTSSILISADCAPVELSKFIVTPVGNAIMLDWEVASEILFDGYELQRSLDGVEFEKIAWVQGSENSLEAKQYNYKDINVKANITYYYRLKMIDLDETFEYSPIRSAQIGGKGDAIAVYPNPTNTTVNLTIDVPKDDRVNIRFYDTTGKVAMERVQDLNEGSNVLSYNVGNLPSGLYRIIIEGQQIRATQNVVVMD